MIKVQIWFQNKRAKTKEESKPHGFSYPGIPILPVLDLSQLAIPCFEIPSASMSIPITSGEDEKQASNDPACEDLKPLKADQEDAEKSQSNAADVTLSPAEQLAIDNNLQLELDQFQDELHQILVDTIETGSIFSTFFETPAEEDEKSGTEPSWDQQTLQPD